MNFLITRDFFKNIPKEKIKQVKERLAYFYDEISKNKKSIFEAPKGFWVKKLRPNLYEFRVNSGDRILFEFRRTTRPGEGNIYEYNNERKELLLLSFGKHDIAINDGIKKNNISNEKVDEFDFTIVQNEDELKKLEEQEKSKSELESEKEINDIYNKINSKVVYEVTSDQDLKELIENDDDYAYFYLNDEQYDILNDDSPLFLKGSAGSGKTTVAIRKALELEEWQMYKVGYITFTQPLKEKAKEMYGKFRDKENNERMVMFYSLEELYEKRLKKKSKGIKKFDKFINEYNPTMPKNIEKLELYQEMRGIIKGGMSANGSGNWQRNLNNKLIEKEDYLNLNKKSTVYSEIERKEIYKFTEVYQNWLDENNYLDENDLARNVILEEEEMFDFIICDEVQDLTEVEIFMLKSLVTGGENLFFAGDIHQIINPTYFNFSRVKSLFYQEKYIERSLEKNYRSQKKIVDLANKLSDLRGEYIGKLGEDYKEASIIEGEDIFVCHENIEFLGQLGENTTIILVPNRNIKKILMEKVENIKNKIYTVQEIKGLEFDSVILYNFGTELQKYWKKIFAKEAKNNQMYRYYFNILYVGLTRAKKRLLIMEKNIDNDLLDNINDYLVELSIEARNEFTRKSGEADFLKEGKEFLKQGIFDGAINAFEKAGATEYVIKAKNELKAKNYYEENGDEKAVEFIVENQNAISKCMEKYIVLDKVGDNAFEKRKYDIAKSYYNRSENNSQLSKIYELEGMLEKSIEYAKKIDEKENLERLEGKLSKNQKAIKIAKEIIVLSDKKIVSKNYSLLELENLSRKYLLHKEKKNLGEIFAILNGRFTSTIQSGKKYSITSPMKLLIKLSHIEGGENGIDYLLENNSDQIKLNKVIQVLDEPKVIEKYYSKNKNKLDLNKLLVVACESQKEKNTLKLINLGADIETKNKSGNSLLEISINNNNLKLVKILIEKGISLENQDSKEISILKNIISMKEFNINMLEYLLEKVDVNYGFPILEAVKSENLEALKLLISKKAKFEEERLKPKEIKENSKPKEKLLLEAIDTNNYDIVKILVEAGINLKEELKENEYSAMELIIYKKLYKVMKLFLDKGYELTKREIELLSNKKDFRLLKPFLESTLGLDYEEKIESKMIPIREDKNWRKTEEVKENKSVEKYYDFEIYRNKEQFKEKEEKEIKERMEEKNG